ncbi:hypothetical protein MMC31_002119 [Peltigera leucophlebia]|nr:hypothetical protein [Peltigera leucophlebia]
MTYHQEKVERQSWGIDDQGKSPQPIEKPPSRILNDIEPNHPFSSLSTSQTLSKEPPQLPSQHENEANRKRKRSQVRDEPIQKRVRTSLIGCAVKSEGDIESKFSRSINHWIQQGSWPNEHCYQEDNMNHLLARTRSASSLYRGQSGSDPATPSDQHPREEKSAPYTSPIYRSLLATEGSYMEESELNITEASQNLCQILLDTKQTVPHDSLFRDDLFDETCRSLQGKNEARVVRDISPLICPSAEILAIYNAVKPKYLIDSVNEGWNNSIPVTKPRPQPDYSVGFRRSAFTDDQLKKLGPFIGGVNVTSFLMATYYMYFPFLTCEVKCGAVALDIADRQNAHSMTVAVKGVVELFRQLKREKELHRKILAFSISHDDTTVRIYGHYALTDEEKTTFYRHPIHKFDFTVLGGKEKWTAYKFTKNIYDKFMPAHHKLICSAIDDIPPDLDFGVASVVATSVSPSQDTTPSNKRRRLPPVVQREAELENREMKLQIDQLKWQNDLIMREREREKEEREERQKKEEREWEREREWQRERERGLKEQISQLMDLMKQQRSVEA